MAPPRSRKFDLEKFNSMVEPFRIRVEKIKGNGKTSIPLPPSPSTGETGPCHSPQEGWTAGDVSRLEQWLITEWSGGGFYVISIVDAAGKGMEWDANYDPMKHPEMVPPPLQSVAEQQANAAAAAAAAAAPHPTSVQDWGGGFLPMHAYGQTIPTQQLPLQPHVFPGGQPAMNYRTPTGIYPYPPTPVSVQVPVPVPVSQPRDRDQELDRENRELRARLDESLRATDRQRYEAEIKLREVEARYTQQAAQQKSDFDAQFRALQDDLREFKRSAERAAERPPVDIDAKFESLVERLIKPLLGNRDDDRVKRLEDELRRANEARERDVREVAHRNKEDDRVARLEDELRRANEARDRDTREAALRSEIGKMQDRMERMMQTLTDAQRDRGPDPALQILQASMNNQVEAMKQIATSQQLGMNQLAQFMTPPATLITMMRDASNGSDALMKNVMTSFSSMFDLFREGVQNVLQLGGSNDSPVLGAVKEGAAKLSELAEGYMRNQRDQALAEARVKQAYIDAQADVSKAQLDAQFRAVQPPPQALPAQATAPEAAAPQPAPRTGPGAARAPEQPDAPRRRGKTDLEWFGPALQYVLNLREAAALFVDATKAKPYKRDADGQVLGAAPVQAAQFITQAAAQIHAQNLDVPAFSLFLQERYADLLDLLLPGAPQPYRDEVVGFLTSNVSVPASELGEEVEEDEEEGEEEGQTEPAETDAVAPSREPAARTASASRPPGAATAKSSPTRPGARRPSA